MSPETWQKINEIFNDAADLPENERGAFLDGVCADDDIRAAVDKLLAAENANKSFLETPALDISSSAAPKNAGRYKIIKEIGKGGMGSVYLAEREDIHQKVAVKVIKRGLDSEDIVRRFQHETEILATLEHPNIARLIDSGTTDDGLPFYVMELVEGAPIDEHCKSLPLDEKLQLFGQICKAVAYAHARLIVHRDLKPSNIVVNTDGTVKLLDFGIAKLISDDNFGKKGTATSLGMMTPNYASPEQFRGEQVTTATDVYSLGVILHELLTGVLPHDLTDKTLDKIFVALSSELTVRPSDLVTERLRDEKKEVSGDESAALSLRKSVAPSELRGDLDNIILKALKKEPERRYASVNDFAEDIRRFQSGLPVAARPDTFRYRASKFISRNKIAVGAAALVILTVVAGIFGIGYQYAVAARQRALAEKRFNDVRELANKVVFRYHDEIAKFPGAVALREELVQDAVKYLDALNSEELDDDQLKLELGRAYEKIGDAQGRPYAANLGKTEDALASYQKAVDILKKAADRSPSEVALKRELVRAYIRLIALEARLGKTDYQNALEPIVNLQIGVNEADRSNPNQNANELAEVYILQGDYTWKPTPEKIEVFKKAFDLLINIPDKTLEIQHQFSRVNQRLGTNYVWVGDDLAKNGDKEKAAENYRNALPYNENMFESIKAEIAIGGSTQNLQRLLAGANQNLGENYFKLGEKEKGLEMLQKNLEIVTELAKADEKDTEAQIDVANAHISFADAYKQFGDYRKSMESNAKSLEIFEKLLALDEKNLELSSPLIRCLHTQAELLEKTHRASEAKNYRNRLTELCKSDSNLSPCQEITLTK